METARKAFEKAFNEFLSAVYQLGQSPHNLLHHQERSRKLTCLKETFEAVVQTAAQFDAAVAAG
jgi:hypothetical protein